MALAIATNTTPAQWLNESAETVLTAIHLLKEANERSR